MPWLALTRWELEVDRENWSTTRFGSLASSVHPEAMHSIRDFHVQCVQADAGDNRLGPGVHSARLLARILGVSTPIASNTVSITFDCLTGRPEPRGCGCQGVPLGWLPLVGLLIGAKRKRAGKTVGR